MNRHVLLFSALLVIMAGRTVVPAAGAPQQKTRKLAPLRPVGSHLQVPSSVPSAFVSGGSQSQPLPALATKTPRIGPKSSPLAIPLLALPENPGEEVTEPQKARSVQISAEDIPPLELPQASGESAVEPLQARQPQVSASALPVARKLGLKAPQPRAPKSILPALLAPKDLAALKEIERPESALSSQMTKVLTYKDLSQALQLQTDKLCSMIELRAKRKEAGKDLKVTVQAQKAEEYSSLRHIIHSSAEVVQILQQIVERQLTLSESQHIPRLKICVNSIKNILAETRLEVEKFDRAIASVARNLSKIIESAPTVLTSGEKETERIKLLLVEQLDVYASELRLKALFNRMQALLGKVAEEQQDIIGAVVTEEA